MQGLATLVASARPAAHTPRLNHLLAALPRRDYERLAPWLEPFGLRRGQAIHGPGERESHLYFPTSGLVCRFHVTSDGAFTGLAVTGAEGVIGVASFLGADSTLSESVVLGAGLAYRISAGRLHAEVERRGALAELLLRYTQSLIAQTGTVAACIRHHSLRQRTCFWLLQCVDRLAPDEVTLTQEVLAEIVGVRREGITQALGELQAARLIGCHRGGISVFDRPGLEARACECYAAVGREHARLLGESRQPAAELAA